VPGPLDNAAIAERLEALASLLDLAGASRYSARAYRRAAGTIRETPVAVEELVRAGRARELGGVGAGIETRLAELVETGRIAELDELELEVRPQLLRRVESPPDLMLPTAREVAGRVAEALGGEVAGDARRWVDAPRELAVVVAAPEPGRVLDAFAALGQVAVVAERTERRAVGVTVDGIPVAVVAAEPGRFGTELVRATGSRAYVEALGPLPDAPDERALYAALGVPWCPPELRDSPFRGEPPRLVELADIRGDLHCHTTWSDGRASVLEMGLAARELGHAYLAICDHTPSVTVVPGLDAAALRRQADEIAAANEELAPFRLLRGAEVDIRADGSLDLPDDVLAELDWVQLSLHAGQRESGPALTAKVTEAMRHPAVRCLSHPTGRLIGRRPPNALDVERVIEVALETGVALEVNGLPARLDLRGAQVRLAVEAGVPIVCSTDAHSPAGLLNLELSVATARRGWATSADVLNARPLAEVLR
jgi:DNA polymerase (family 10)